VTAEGGAQDWFQITEEVLVPGQLYDAVAAPAHGAVVTFAGVVRDNAEGRRTRYLEYEAYGEMARAELAAIGGRIKERWSMAEVAIIHRVGRVEIGELSVLIAVASPHRGEAFEACGFAIDQVKETVPIWKKEVFEDGELWVGGQQGASRSEAL